MKAHALIKEKGLGMMTSKLLIAGLALGGFLFAPTAYAQANDILSILERNAQNETIKPPKTIPYIYTIEFDVSGKEDRSKAKNTEKFDAADLEDDALDHPVEITVPEGETPKIDLENYTAVIEVNPSLSGDARVKIVSHSGDAEDKAFKALLAEYTSENVSQEDLASSFWCDNDDFSDDELGFIKEAFTVLSQTDSEAIVKPDLTKMAKLLLDSSSDEDISKGEKKMMRRMLKRLDGEVRFTKPDGRMTDMKVWMTRPMRVMLIAKIRDMKFSSSCELAPSGFGYAARQNMEVKMSAFGVKVDQNTYRRVTNLRPLP